MNEKVESFAEEYTEVVKSCERFAFLPRGTEYQKRSIKELTELFEKSALVRGEVIQDGDENAANKMLALRCMINALRYDLKMWVDLRDENWATAWAALVDAQGFAKSARSAHDIAKRCNVENYLQKLRAIEEFVFPPQMFQSPGMYIKDFKCSLCGNDYDECDHIAGKPYWGFFCQRIPQDILGFREVSIVDNPEDKKARITEFVTDEGTVRDRMTWEESEMSEEDKEQYLDRDDDGLIIRGIVMTATDSETDFSKYFPED